MSDAKRLLLTVDGWPHTVVYDGHLDIERMWDGETVAVRGDVVAVSPDNRELEKQRKLRRELREDKERFLRSFDDVLREACQEFLDTGGRGYCNVRRT